MCEEGDQAVLNGRELTFLTEAERRHRGNVEKQISISERRPSDAYIKDTV